MLLEKLVPLVNEFYFGFPNLKDGKFSSFLFFIAFFNALFLIVNLVEVIFKFAKSRNNENEFDIIVNKNFDILKLIFAMTYVITLFFHIFCCAIYTISICYLFVVSNGKFIINSNMGFDIALIVLELFIFHISMSDNVNKK